MVQVLNLLKFVEFFQMNIVLEFPVRFTSNRLQPCTFYFFRCSQVYFLQMLIRYCA